MLTQTDITPILFSAAGLGLLIVVILAAYIPAGKLPEDKQYKSDPDAKPSKRALRMARNHGRARP